MAKANGNDSRERETSPLRQARRRAGLTAEALALRAGVSLGWVRVIERAPGLMSPALAARLAATLGVDPRDVLGASPASRPFIGGTTRRIVG